MMANTTNNNIVVYKESVKIVCGKTDLTKYIRAEVLLAIWLQYVQFFAYLRGTLYIHVCTFASNNCINYMVNQSIEITKIYVHMHAYV